MKSYKSVISINQHNYEEFFLLYVDRELSAADKQAVEQFVRANPGLAYELEMLQQAMLAEEEIIFDAKHNLYRNETKKISPNNYEEQFLLYVDNELNTDEKENVERFVLQHPALQESFTLLKQMQLEPETISFPGKELLYRKEGKEKPVSLLRRQQVAVAAALIGFVVLMWTLFPANIPSKQNLTIQQTVTKSADRNNTIGSEQNKAKNPMQVAGEQRAGVLAATPVSPNPIATHEKNKLVETPATTNNLAARNESMAQPVETTGGNTGSVSGMSSETVPSHIQTLPVENTSMSGIDMVKANNNTDEYKRNFANDAQQAVYKELDTEDDKKSLLLGSLEINKDKLRGFFRKAGSIFRSKAKMDDDKTETSSSANTKSLK